MPRLITYHMQNMFFPDILKSLLQPQGLLVSFVCMLFPLSITGVSYTHFFAKETVVEVAAGKHDDSTVLP